VTSADRFADARARALAAFHACGGERLDLFSAIRFLESELAAEQGTAEEPLEGIRFGGSIDFAFPATELSRARLRSDGRIALTVTALGFTGALGVLPAPYTEMLQRLVRGKDLALRDFLDLFQDRLVDLFYRAHAKYRLALAYGRERRGDRPDASEATLQVLLSYLGLGMEGLRGRMGIADERLLPLAAVLARRVRTAPDIAQVLSVVTGWPVTVEQFHGQWLSLPAGEQSRLAGDHARLGVDLVAGARVYDLAGSVVLHVGPLPYEDFIALVAGGEPARVLAETARFCLGPEIAFVIRAVLHRAEVPPLRLGRRRLGWETWLGRPGGEAAVTVAPAARWFPSTANPPI
jgi:type VI secretion system protein ImpH